MNTREGNRTLDPVCRMPLVPMRRVSASVIAPAMVRVLGDQGDYVSAEETACERNEGNGPMEGNPRSPSRTAAPCAWTLGGRLGSTPRRTQRTSKSFYSSVDHRKTYSGGRF